MSVYKKQGRLFEKGNKICVGRIPWNKGKKGIYSEEYRNKLSNSRKEGLANGTILTWNKGKYREDSGVDALHLWVRNNLTRPMICPSCNIRQTYEVANISNKYDPNTYNRELKNWRWTCRKCHVISDGRCYNIKKK